MLKTILLGRGYVGNFYCQKNNDCLYTNRKHDETKSNGILFDLYDKKTWYNLPQTDNVIWTFPAAKINDHISIALDFYNFYCKNKKTIILSSTSAYLNKLNGELITEESELDLNNIRTTAEEELRKNGACILHLSGIFGPERLPIHWYQSLRVKNPNNYVNLVHIQDIIHCIESVLKKFKFFERYNVTNGYHKKHIEIIDELIKRGELTPDFVLPDDKLNSICKRVSNKKIKTEILSSHYNFINYP